MELTAVMDMGVHFGPNEAGEIVKLHWNAKHYRQIRDRVRYIGAYMPCGANVVPAIPQCKIIDLHQLIQISSMIKLGAAANCERDRRDRA